MKTRYLYLVFSFQKQKRKNEWRCIDELLEESACGKVPDAKECYWYLCNIHSGKYQYDKWPERIEDFVSLGF